MMPLILDDKQPVILSPDNNPITAPVGIQSELLPGATAQVNAATRNQARLVHLGVF
jgi:hypothetical protein